MLNNPYKISEKHAAHYVRLTVEELRCKPIPYLQHKGKIDRLYKRSDLDKFIKRNIRYSSGEGLSAA